jgi:hypothetical protein
VKALAAFVALQTFIVLGRADRFAVLFWWDAQAWPWIVILWVKDIVLSLLAAALAVWVVRATFRIEDRNGGSLEPAPSPGRSVLLAAPLFAAVGVWLRWVALDLVPPGLWPDVLFESEPALRHAGSTGWIGGLPLLVDGVPTSSTLVSKLWLEYCRGIYALFGRGEVGIVAISAVGSCLALAAVFWLAWEVSGKKLAVATLALVAVGRWPLALARWTWTASVMLPLVLAAAAASLAAIRTRRTSFAAAAGLFLGLSLHTYAAAWAAAAGLGLFSLSLLRRREHRPLVAAAVLAAIVAFAPFGIGYLEHPERIGGRTRDVPVGTAVEDRSVPLVGTRLAVLGGLAYNLVRYTGIWLWTGDPDPLHGLRLKAVVDPLLGVAALIGCAVSFRRAARGGLPDRLLLLLTAGSLLAGVLSNTDRSPNVLRAENVLGPTFIWAASGLLLWIEELARRRRVRRLASWGLVAACTVVTEILPVYSTWIHDPLAVATFLTTETAAGRLRCHLGAQPTLLAPGSFRHPIVVEALANPDPHRPPASFPVRTASQLLATPPATQFWYFAKRHAVAVLRAAGWRVSRPTAPGPGAEPVLVFVSPPAAISDGRGLRSGRRSDGALAAVVRPQGRPAPMLAPTRPR